MAGAGAGKPTGSPSSLLSAVLLEPVSCPIQRWLRIWPALYRTRVAHPLSWDREPRLQGRIQRKRRVRGWKQDVLPDSTLPTTPDAVKLPTRSAGRGSLFNLGKEPSPEQARKLMPALCLSVPMTKRGRQRLHVLNRRRACRQPTRQSPSTQGGCRALERPYCFRDCSQAAQ